MNLKSIIDNRSININCDDCAYTFNFKYSELKSRPMMVFCPICQKEKELCSKEELSDFLVQVLESL